jgi:hypothetical protein
MYGNPGQLAEIGMGKNDLFDGRQDRGYENGDGRADVQK